ncbi:hypothetical protein BD410DRAFT_785439 [Rickenella mellea]|uniref:Uncharacterized protein n=1 Tax=Rickenella mellea TaxID=50990 RepID=A0A4Y7QAW3_9AGAM|nr:hypothetical protein BD410DRAFT_785439 [Rickenella mellea]
MRGRTAIYVYSSYDCHDPTGARHIMIIHRHSGPFKRWERNTSTIRTVCRGGHVVHLVHRKLCGS